MSAIENCLNCEADNGQCYECYILSGNEFTDYVLSFYGNGGVYDMKATQAEVVRATNIRNIFKHLLPFECDTVDRELVRDIIIEMRAA